MKYSHHFKSVLLSFAISITFVACINDDEKDLTYNINKQGAVESAVTTEHLDSVNDVLLTTHTVWRNGSVIKTIIYKDTVPALGMLNTTGENNNGETKPLQVKKDYEIYITVK